MKIKPLFFILIAITILISCKKKNEEILSSNTVANIELLNPEIMSDGGVNLSIKVNNVPIQSIYNFALIVSEDSLFTKILHIKQFEIPLSIRSYSYSFSSGFKTNQKYYYSYTINYSPINRKEVKSFVFVKRR